MGNLEAINLNLATTKRTTNNTTITTFNLGVFSQNGTPGKLTTVNRHSILLSKSTQAFYVVSVLMGKEDSIQILNAQTNLTQSRCKHPAANTHIY